MDELKACADRPLELADMLRAALHVARGPGTSRPAERLHQPRRGRHPTTPVRIKAMAGRQGEQQ